MGVQDKQVETYLRPATGSEAPLVYRLMEDYYHEVHSSIHPKKHRWAVEKLFENPAVGKLWLIMVGRDVVGYVVVTLGYSLELAGMDACLEDVYIVPAARSRGIGRAATQMAMSESARLGARAIHLEVEPGNARTRAFYRHLGFQDRGSHQMSLRLAGEEPS